MTRPVPLDLSVSTVVAADPETVYDLVADITRISRWSPETVSTRWLDGATAAAPGVRFAGTNVVGRLRWTTKPRIEAAERGVRFAFRVPGAAGPLWSYDFEPREGGTLVTKSMVQRTVSPAVLRWLLRRSGVHDRAAHLRAGMTTTLHRLAQAAVAQDDRASVR